MAERERRRSFAALAGDGALLLCALLGLTGSFLSLYGNAAAYGLPPGPLDRCAAQGELFLLYAALFALLALAVWSLPRFRWGAAGGVAALWALALRARWEAVSAGAVLACKAIADQFAARVPWGKTFDYLSGLTPAGEAACVEQFLLFALALLALGLGWAVARGRRWWIVVLLTLPPLLPGLLADFYPDWLPFMVLCACWCAMLLAGLCRWAAPSARGRLTLTILPASALLLAGLTLALPREGYTRPPWALKAEEELINLSNRLADYLPHWDDGPFHTTITYVGSAGEADLGRAGPLAYTGRTVLRVRSDYDGLLYLRGTSLASYEDGVWKPLPEGTYEAVAPPYRLPTFPLYFPALLSEDGSPVYTTTVENVGAVGACVYAPYFLRPQDAEETGMLPVEDSYLARLQGQWTHTVTFVERDAPEAAGPGGASHVVYTGGTDLGALSRQDISADASRYADFVYRNYLDVPRELREPLASLCRGNGIYGEIMDGIRLLGPIENARAVAALLDELCEYDVAAPAAPEGTDPVLYFLNESRRGYCMHYASAAVLLLRTIGVPARYVSGFTAYNTPSRRVNVPDRAAHAWVEVWVDGFGWYPVEVTPAMALDDVWPGAPGAEPTPTAAPVATPEPTPTPTPEPTPTPAPGESAQPTPTAGPGEVPDGEEREPFRLPEWLWKGLLGTAGVAGLLWLAQLLIKMHRDSRMAGDSRRAALACYGYLLRLKRWGGRVEDRALELAQKAKFSREGPAPAETDELRAMVNRERARLCAVLGPVERLIFRYLWGAPRKKEENLPENPGPPLDKP